MTSVAYEDGLQVGEPEVAAEEPLACDRCGTFARLAWSWGRRLCSDCRSRAHPSLATRPTVFNLMLEGFKLLPAFGVLGIATALVPLPFTLALRAVLPSPDTGDMRLDTLRDMAPTALLALPSGVAEAVLTLVMLQVLVGGGRADYKLAWRTVFAQSVSVLTLSVVWSLLDSVAFLTLKFLGTLLVSIPFTLAYPILLNERVSAWTALRRSAFRMRGQQLRMLGVMALWSLPLVFVMAAVAIAAFSTDIDVGEIVMQYLHFLEGSHELLALPTTAIGVLLYAKLPPRMRAPGAAVAAPT